MPVRRPRIPALLLPALAAACAWAQPAVRAPKGYEDTVRVLLISNLDAIGKCGGPTGPVGGKTRDFVLQSLSGIPNVASLDAAAASWDAVLAVWPGRLPHVIVHVNAGWKSRSGTDLGAIMDRAAEARVGVVSIGDDAAAFADQTFGFHDVDNVPQPMGDARQYDGPGASLWIDLDGPGDTLASGGILRNTVGALGVRRLDFLPVEPEDSPAAGGRYRCQADADKYAVQAGYAGRVTFLGFQRAFDGEDTVGGPRELQVIAAFQDNARRGVALSYQPQFLADARAAHQIDYDAVIYASYAHAIDPPRTDPPVVPPPVDAPVVEPPRVDPPGPRDAILSVSAYPPVAGDPRPGAWEGVPGASGVPLWIPPAGFSESPGWREHPFPAIGQATVGADPSAPRELPRGHALVRVLSRGKYLAHVRIHDPLGNVVRTFRQSFGYRGELDNGARAASGGWQSFLAWDMRDDRGARAGQGAYIWRIELIQENGSRKRITLRTGLLRP